MTHHLEAIAREIEALLGPEELRKARYQLQMRVWQFGVHLLVALGLALLWLPTGWAVALRDALHGNAHVWNTWLVLLVFMLVESGLTLPLAWFFDFRLESRLGTTRQSLASWLGDTLKERLANIGLQSLLFTGLYGIFRRWPRHWLWGMAGLVLLFLLAFYLLSPLLLRLRFKTRPLEDPDLRARLAALFARAGLPFEGLAVLEAAVKSSRANAAVVPKGMGNQVIVSDTLLQMASPEEIESVVAHEIGHRVHRDLPRLMLLLGMGLMAALAAGYQILVRFGTGVAGLQGPGDVATFPLLMAVVTWLAAGMQVLLNLYSRGRERAADLYALRLTDDPAAFERVMVALARQNKTVPQPPAWIEFLLYNHPSIARRVHLARQWPFPQA